MLWKAQIENGRKDHCREVLLQGLQVITQPASAGFLLPKKIPARSRDKTSVCGRSPALRRIRHCAGTGPHSLEGVQSCAMLHNLLCRCRLRNGFHILHPGPKPAAAGAALWCGLLVVSAFGRQSVRDECLNNLPGAVLSVFAIWGVIALGKMWPVVAAVKIPGDRKRMNWGISYWHCSLPRLLSSSCISCQR